MNKTALLALIATKTAAAQALINKGGAGTAEDVTAAKAIAEEIKLLRGQAADIDSTEAILQDATDFLNKGGPGLPGKSVGSLKRDSSEKDAGADYLEVKANGRVERIGHSGLNLSEKQFRLMQEPAYEQAFRSYLRSGVGSLGRTDLDTLSEVKAYAAGIDTTVGFLVPPQYLQEIISRDPASTEFLDLVRTIPMTSDTLKVPKTVYNTGDGDIYTNALRLKRTGETQAPATQTDQQIGEIEIKMHSGSSEVPITRELLQDTSMDVISWVTEMFRESFDLDTVYELTFGDGLKQPEGILLNAGNAGGIPIVNVGSPISADGIIKGYKTLPKAYRKNGKFLMNDTNTLTAIQQLKDTAGNYIGGLSTNTAGGLATDRMEQILGKETIENPFMADPGANALFGAFGDWRRTYYYGIRLAVTLEMQMLARDAYAYAVFRIRNGGKVVNPRAARILRQQ